jgi:hypothetical protein
MNETASYRNIEQMAISCIFFYIVNFEKLTYIFLVE